MPILDGYRLAGAIRLQEHPLIEHLPIIAITADATAGVVDRCYAAGMDDYLTKPMRLEQLQQMLARWLPTGAAQPRPQLPHQPPHQSLTPEVSIADVPQPPVDLTALVVVVGDNRQTQQWLYQKFVESSSTIVAAIQQAG